MSIGLSSDRFSDLATEVLCFFLAHAVYHLAFRSLFRGISYFLLGEEKGFLCLTLVLPSQGSDLGESCGGLWRLVANRSGPSTPF